MLEKTFEANKSNFFPVLEGMTRWSRDVGVTMSSLRTAPLCRDHEMRVMFSVSEAQGLCPCKKSLCTAWVHVVEVKGLACEELAKGRRVMDAKGGCWSLSGGQHKLKQNFSNNVLLGQ